jgi:hypothetical protein
MLWASVGWPERTDDLDGFGRLLVIPLLLAQFRRSENSEWVLYGFLAAAVALLVRRGHGRSIGHCGAHRSGLLAFR